MSGELSGYLDVKVPAKVRRRGFTPWKAWKKQWCVVTPSENSSVSVQIGSSAANVIHIAPDCTFCHSSSRSRQFAFGVYTNIGQTRRPLIFLAGSSESETQNWMVHIRNLLHPEKPFDLSAHCGDGVFPVSFIDNSLTQSVGLSGFYGLMAVEPCHIRLTSASVEDSVASWDWSHFHQFHLAASGKPEDENKICVIHTSSEFPGGPGQLYIFCLDAPRLLEVLLRRGRTRPPTRPPSRPLPLPLHSSRRLSRSESDLRCYCSVAEAAAGAGTGAGSPSKFLRRAALIRSHSGSRDSGVRVSTASDDSAHDLQGKVANSVLSAGLGLLLSTPGCSEADNESLHEYQHIGLEDGDDDDDRLAALFRASLPDARSPRRESGISLASGIYEEIADDVFPAPPPHGPSHPHEDAHYENPAALAWRKSLEGRAALSPPPLPPRRIHGRPHCSMSEEALDERVGVDEGGGAGGCGGRERHPALGAWRQGSFPGYSASCSALASSLPPSLPSALLPWERPHGGQGRGDPPRGAEPDYVPMSPRGPAFLPPPLATLTALSPRAEESPYMVMASIKPS